MSSLDLSPAVDAVRQSLEHASDRWFWWLVASSILVGIGVVLEAPEATIALKRWIRLRAGKNVAPENERSLAILASYLGLLLVIGGVVGEGVFESLASRAEVKLRAHDEQILTAATIEAGQAKSSALSAATASAMAVASSGTAKDASNGATTSAANALKLAVAARRESESFAQDIVTAKNQAASAESHLAEALERATNAQAELNRLTTPRTIANISILANELRKFKGTKYGYAGVFQDQESINLLKSIEILLHSAEWVRVPVSGPGPGSGLTVIIGEQFAVPPSIVSGIHVETSIPQTLVDLQKSPA